MDYHKFSLIKAEYKKYHQSFLAKGQLPQRPTKVGFWAASNPDQIYELCNRLALSGRNKVLDLGSGDGIAIAIFSLFSDATGVEYDEELHFKAIEMQDKFNLKCKFKCANFHEEDLSVYDTIFIAPDNYFYKLEAKLLKEFNGTLIILENMYKPISIKPETKLSILGKNFLIFKIRNN